MTEGPPPVEAVAQARSTDYLVAVGNVPEALYPEIAASTAQWDEWRDTLRIAELKPASDHSTDAAKLEFIQTHPTLALDTSLLSDELKGSILDAFDDLAAVADGVLVHGDNLPALRLMATEYAQAVKCIYIDPPYNAGSDESVYHDSFESAAWLDMMADRLRLAWDLLSPAGIFFISIDSRERRSLGQLLSQLFAGGTELPEISVKVKDPAGVGQQALLFDVLEYLQVYAKDFPNLQRAHAARSPASYEEIAEPVRHYRHWIADYGTPRLVDQVQRPAAGLVRIYACETPDIRKSANLAWPDEYVSQAAHIYADYNPSGGMIKQIRHLIPAKGLSFIEYVPTRGRSSGVMTRVYFQNRRILARLSDIVEIRSGKPYRRSVLTNLWEAPNATLNHEGGVTFRHGKKPLAMIETIVRNFTSGSDVVLDFFAGSGTTGHAAINLNREDGGRRRFVLVEMADHFDTVLLPRIKKAMFTPDWRSGKPRYRLSESDVEGTPRVVKVLRM